MGCLAALLIVLAASCSSGDDEPKVRKPAGTPTSPPVAWQRPQSAISQETPVIHLTGVLRLHKATVNDVAFSANGTRLASVGADDVTAVWNLANGEPLFVRSGSDGRRVFFGPGDETLITVNRDGLTRLWAMDMHPPRELQELASFSGQGGIVVQSPDHTLLAFGDEAGQIGIWRVPDGVPVVTMQAHREPIQYLEFSPDGQLLVSVSVERELRVWSVPSGDLLYDLANPEVENIQALYQRAAFSPDSKRLAAAAEVGVQMWDMESGALLYTISAVRNAASSALVFSPDGNLLVGCGAQPLIGVWAVSSGEPLGLLPLPGQYCADAMLSPDSTLMITLPVPGTDVYLWNLVNITEDVRPDQKHLDRASRQTMGLLAGTRFFDVAWSGDGRFIVLLDELGPMYVLTAVG